MMPGLVGEDLREAQRILHGLKAEGISAALVDDLSALSSRLSTTIQVKERQAEDDSQGPIVTSAAMASVLELAARVARADISVLVAGESGTGKEVMCRFIHEASARSAKPFTAVNCAAIPEAMLEDVLFGHEKGSFTGASEMRLGKFEIADGGTLLLDEITEMPIALQAKLLRVLQEREVERIGSNRPRKVDVRVLATSNRELHGAVTEGVLREDLFYRLSVFPIVLPPLRERKEDIVPLALHLLRKHAPAGSPYLSEAARDLLIDHDWPGNVRELENCMQRAIVLCEHREIVPADLGLSAEPGVLTTEQSEATLQGRMRQQEDQLLLKILKQNNGVRKATAAQLGISERTLRYKLKQLRDRGLLR